MLGNLNFLPLNHLLRHHASKGEAGRENHDGGTDLLILMRTEFLPKCGCRFISR